MTVNLNAYHYGGSSAAGDAPTSTANSWVSYTFPKPSARKAMNGTRPIIVKRLTFKVCGRTAARKIFARVSTADGHRYDNSTTQTISWQHEATSTYSFSGVNFHFTDADGSHLRVWLVSGGAFYFNRNTGAAGHLVSDSGRTFTGAPVGEMFYAEVASAPTGLTGVRDATDNNKIVFSWKREADDGGAGRMGYRLQIAEDAAFTVALRNEYIPTESVAVFGLSQSKPLYARVATRNEVSEYYKLAGGVWSTVASVAPVSTGGGTTVPPDDTGLPGGSTTGGGGGSTSGGTPAVLDFFGTPTPNPVTTPVPASTAAVLQCLIRANATGEYFISQTYTETGGDHSVRLSRLSATGTFLDSMKLTRAGLGQRFEVEVMNGQTFIWSVWRQNASAVVKNDFVRFQYKPGTFGYGAAPGWSVRSAGDGSSRLVAFDWGRGFAALRQVGTDGTTVTYSRHRLAAVQLGDFTGPLDSFSPGEQAFRGFATYRDSLFLFTGDATDSADYASNHPTLTEYAWAGGADVKTVDETNLGKVSGAFPGGRGEPGSVSVYEPDGSSATLYLTVTVGAAGGPYTFDVFGYPLLDDATAVVVTPASNPPTDTVVFTPLPDISSTETVKGGLLLARATTRNPGHTVYVMDRGGKYRIAEFKNIAKIQWTRVRDGISTTTVELAGSAIEQNLPLLKQLAVGRHELQVWRGDEQVWEGPVTYVQRSETLVTVQAQDVMWYATRTAMHGGYSNAYPNLTYVVERAAGIFVNELARKEALDPPINVLPYVRTYIEDGDARTTLVTVPFETTVWEHIDQMAAQNGMDYTVIGRAVHFWDTSRAALGRTRVLTAEDFDGNLTITEYGAELATTTWVTDGQGRAGVAGAPDAFYGEIELLATAYGESGNSVTDPTSPDVGQQVPQDQLDSQARRNLDGRNPIPTALHVGAGASIDVSRNGLGMNVLVPGVYVPLRATIAGKTVSQTQKIQDVKVIADGSGETITVSLYPASEDQLFETSLV